MSSSSRSPVNRKHLILGIFVAISLGLLLWLAKAVGVWGPSDGRRYELRLEHAAGLVKHDDVKIAGVKVGVLEKVGVDHDRALLILRVDPEAVLHDDCVAIVRAKRESLLGEKYLQLEPGSREAPVLTDGAEIRHSRSMVGGDDSIAGSVGPLMAHLERLLVKAMGEGGQAPLVTREELRQLVEDSLATVAALRRIAERNDEGISELVDRSNALLADPRVPRILAQVDELSGSTAEGLPGLLERADRALSSIERATGELTHERVAKLEQTLDDVAVVTAELRQISESLGEGGQELGPLLKALRVTFERTAMIDELGLREFLQKEGVNVNLGTPGEVKKKIKQLEGE